MKYLLYGLTGVVLVCDLLFIALIICAIVVRENMVLMFAPFLFLPSLFVSATVVFLLNRIKSLLASNQGIYKFNVGSFFGCIAIIVILPFMKLAPSSSESPPSPATVGYRDLAPAASSLRCKS